MLFAPTGALGSSPRESLDIVQPDARLLFPVLNSPTYNWLVVLTLEDLNLGVDLLLSISQLRNVSFMSIFGQSRTTPEPGLSDRIVRSWAHDVSDHGAFSRLEAIFLDGQANVTAATMQHLNSFPRLETFCLNMCGVKSPSLDSLSTWTDTIGSDHQDSSACSG
jgi:hypothetical protein